MRQPVTWGIETSTVVGRERGGDQGDVVQSDLGVDPSTLDLELEEGTTHTS